MDHERFREWFSHVDELTTAQCKEVAAVLSDPPVGAASLAAIELGVDDERRCPHCASAGAVSRGKARGLRRYRCKACGKTFGALTGTALSGLHHKERWLAFGASLGAGETIREAAERCGIAPSTAHRWRHRFLAAVRQAPDGLPGSSRRTRPSFSRAGRGSAGSASRASVPILVARAERDPQPHLARPQRKEREGGAPVVARETARLRRRCYPPVGGAGHPSRETASGFAAPCTSSGQQPPQPDQGLPAGLPRHRHQVPRQPQVVPSHRTRRSPSPRACLKAAMARPCLRFAN